MKQEVSRILLLHLAPALAQGLRHQLRGVVVCEGPEVPAEPVDILVVDGAAARWQQAVDRVRRSHPGVRVVLVAPSLEVACLGINQLGVGRVAAGDDEVVECVNALANAPLGEAQRLEREVQHRTALLQQIKSQWEQSVDAVQDPLAVVDEDFRLIRVNRAYARHMGRAIVEVPGQRCYELRARSAHTYPADTDGTCSGCPVRQNGRPITHGENARRPARATLVDHRQRRWMVSAYPVEIAGSPRSLVVHYRDITQEAEHLRKLARADKMSAVGKLAGAVAHELNSPMTSVMVFSESLARKTTEGTELREHAEEISNAAVRCRRLIQGLLRFARRPRERQSSSVALPSLVSEVEPLVRHRMHVGGLRLELALPDDLQPVLGYENDIEHLLVDLLSNSIEACQSGDTIRISARYDADQQMVELTVEDSGRGMTPEELEGAFDPFFSTKPAGQAAGLGLTTCEAMVTEMGGTMGLRSTLGEGTGAWFRLPAAASGDRGQDTTPERGDTPP